MRLGMGVADGYLRMVVERGAKGKTGGGSCKYTVVGS